MEYLFQNRILITVGMIVGMVIGMAYGQKQEAAQRAAICLDTMATVDAAAGKIWSMTLAGASQEEMKAFYTDLFAEMAAKHKMKPEELVGICDKNNG